MRILVTGAGGQLGTEVMRLADAAVERIGLTHTQLDISDPATVEAALRQHRPQVVVNCAAFTAVDPSETDRSAAFRVNATGPGVLAAGCARLGIPLIHVSTDYVFDGRKTTPYLESDPVSPINVYGESKAAGEAEVRSRSERHIIVRTAWLFADHGRNFVRTMLEQARTQREIRVVADQTACPTPAGDLARALVRLAVRTAEGDPIRGTVHYCGRDPVSRFDFARTIIAAAYPNGAAPRIAPIALAETSDIARRPHRTALDCRRFTEFAGYAPRPWREGLAETIARLMAR
jgi:dTDP-4-dehydrorhamnose reductase